MIKIAEKFHKEWEKEEYGICEHCKHQLQFNDDFVDVQHGSCGQSQGHPMAWMKGKVLRYHVGCYKKS